MAGQKGCTPPVGPQEHSGKAGGEARREVPLTGGGPVKEGRRAAASVTDPFTAALSVTSSGEGAGGRARGPAQVHGRIWFTHHIHSQVLSGTNARSRKLGRKGPSSQG